MLIPYVLRAIQLQQNIRQRLTFIPERIFLVNIEWNYHGSSMVDIRDACIGHAIDVPFS